MDGEVDRQRRARRAEGGERLALGHFRGAARNARQHQRLRDLGDGQFAAERGRRRREGGHARRQRVGDAQPLQPPDLLGHRAPHGQIARMQPRHILAGRVRGHIFRLDLVERQRRGIDEARARRAVFQQFRRHDRAGIEADRAGGDEIAPAHRDQVGRARPGADEMHGHLVFSERDGAGHGPDRDPRPRQPRAFARRRQCGRLRDGGRAG